VRAGTHKMVWEGKQASGCATGVCRQAFALATAGMYGCSRQVFTGGRRLWQAAVDGEDEYP
jgi:hypothetical protein